MNVWVIRAGYQDTWVEVSLRKGIIALGFNEVPDMSGIQEKEGLRNLIEKAYPEEKRGRISNFLGQLWSFAREIAVGDVVVMPLSRSDEIVLGEISGPYRFDGSTPEEYAHSREVSWRPDRISLDNVPEDLRRSFFIRNTVRAPKDEAAAFILGLLGKATPMEFDRRAVLGIIEIAKSISENGLEKSRLSKGSPENGRYHEIVKPMLERFRQTHGMMPDQMLEKLLAAYVRTMSNGSEYEAVGYGFYGRVLNSYTWACIIRKDPSITKLKASYKPQLFVLVSSHGIRYGFGYGDYIEESDPRVTIISRDHSMAEHLVTKLKENDELAVYSSIDSTGLPLSGALINRQDAATIRSSWTPSSHVAKSYASEDLPDDVGEHIRGGLNSLVQFFQNVNTADKSPPRPPRPHESYLAEDFAQETGYALSTVHGWQRQLLRKKHIIFQGPPGTGKTFVAEKLGKLMTSDTNGFSEIVQFHPAYSYEDFVQGLRPKPAGHGIVFEIDSGRFLRFCERAAAVGGEDPCVLIIDEINRANLPRVLGELLFLLEYRGREVPLATGGQPFGIPENVYIIGTMNTADRSIALVDYALRRRFYFVRLRPEYDILERHLAKNGLPGSSLVSVLREINGIFEDQNYELGISYFMRDADKLRETLPDIWTGEIEPYLEEYFFDKPNKIQQYRWANLAADRLREWRVG